MSAKQTDASSKCLRGSAARLPRRLLVLFTVAATTLVWSAAAQAGYAIQPASGATVAPDPTFLVYLDSTDTSPTVYVAKSAAMSSSGFPADEVGSCYPTTPWTEPGKLTCKPTNYLSNLSNRLDPGTYYWWLTFYKTDPGNLVPTLHISGPLQITVAPPTEPATAALVSPADNAIVRSAPTLTAHAPAGAEISFHASDSSDRLDDGSPVGLEYANCSGPTSSDDDYTCDVDQTQLNAGQTYYWWVVITVDGTNWTYGPRSFTYKPRTGGGGGSTQPPRSVTFAPYLPSSQHYTGKSVKQARLGRAAYRLSKILQVPRTVAVACWSTRDWTNISGDNPESTYSLLGFWMPQMPRWINLSPGICRSMETLLYHRPQYPNAITADGVDTLTHEMIHALGLSNEAKTECLAMQLTVFTGISLGVPGWYSSRLAHLTLGNYHGHPPAYVDESRCRENGAWDIFPGHNSLPWHDYDF